MFRNSIFWPLASLIIKSRKQVCGQRRNYGTIIPRSSGRVLSIPNSLTHRSHACLVYQGCSIRKSNIIFILWSSCWSWPSTQWAAVRTCQLVIREPPHMGPLGQPSCETHKCRDIYHALDPWIFGCCLFNFKWRLPFLLLGYSTNTCQGYSCSSAGASKLPCIILLFLLFLGSLFNSLVSLLSLVCLKKRRSPQLQSWFYKCFSF